ncbi:MAG: hypothetical protein ABI885_26145 [Gammaproteobacteria bacterium]
MFRNPSGTAQATAQGATAGSFALAALTGHFGIAGTIASTAAGANLTARLMTNPRFVHWLAKTTRAPASALPALVNQAAQSEDGDMRELAAVLAEQKSGQ